MEIREIRIFILFEKFSLLSVNANGENLKIKRMCSRIYPKIDLSGFRKSCDVAISPLSL